MSSNPNCGEPCAYAIGSSSPTAVATASSPVPHSCVAGPAPWHSVEPSFAQITVVLTRQDITKQNDVLTIDVDPYSDGFYVTFEQKVHGIRTRTYYLADNLYKYLGMYFKALSFAEANYKSATFFVPLFPSVTQPINDAKNYLIVSLVPQIQFLMSDWPRV